ncbi:trigger factor [Patescibacteria group bacterium]|nr:trigger factor [Patescibacteria group bacterium]MBU3999909.1 trigger factor [Patescibacteria group bacterium]MBU4056785.1 trigger factor [Patescibacteria group bacterium]MBU4368915.1 trigger factor [Patescibacteria group bacterium]
MAPNEQKLSNGVKTELKKLPKSTFELIVEIPAEKWNGYYNRVCANLSKTRKIDGFRPGKANNKIVAQNFGAKVIFEEVANIAINETFYDALEKNKLAPIGAPKVEVLKIAAENPIIYKATFAVLPKTNIDGYKDVLKRVRIKQNDAKAEDKEIDESIEYLLNSRAKLAAVSRPAQAGDRVEVDFLARLNGVKIEQGESKNHPLIIGKSRFLPEFEKQLTGMKSGENKEFDIVYPKDYYKKELAEKKVRFEIKLNLVQEIITPEFNDDFARALGKFSGAEEVRKNISEGILREKKEKEKEKFRTAIIQELVKKFASGDLPEILIDAEVEQMLHEFKHNIEENGLRFEQYLSQIKKTESDLKSDWRKSAESRVNTHLIIFQVAERENIKITDEETSQEVNKILAKYKNIKEAEKNIDHEKLKTAVNDSLIRQKVFNLLESIALGKK